MKKIIFLLVAILMLSTVVFSVPFTAQATTKAVDCTQVVYKVTNYSELTEAFADSEHDRTIILQNHIFESAVDSQREIFITGSKTVVFDMNGYDITLYSSRTEAMFTVKGSSKVHFVNTDSENSSEIYFDVQDNPATAHASILYFDASIEAKFYSYNINYYVGSEDLYDYCGDVGYQEDYIQSMSEVDIINIKEMGDIYLLGGNFENYYAYGSGIYASTNSICYGLYVRGADFKTGYACLYYNSDSTVLTKITDANLRRIDTGMTRRVIYIRDVDTKLSEITGKNLMFNKNTVVEDMQGMEITTTTLVNDITFDLVFVTDSSKQDCVDESFITPNGHVLIDYETGACTGVIGHKITDVGGFDATCTVEGKEPNKICSLCNYVLEEGKEIPATGHNYTEKVTKKATCTQEGVTTYTCACGDTYTKKIAKVAHVTTKSTKKATYFANGYKNRVTCKVCKKVISKGTTLKKLTLKTPKVKYTAGKKKLTVKYTKVKDATGFQVKYKIGKKTVTKTYNTKKTVSKTIKSLKKGTYKVYVRAFVKSGSKKAYSSWTKAKKVKVK